MKKFKSFILMTIVVLAGAVAAFATNATKSSDDDPEPGYLYDSSTGQCVQRRDNCSTSGNIFCTWKDANNVSHNLFRLNGTTCIRALYEPEE